MTDGPRFNTQTTPSPSPSPLPVLPPLWINKILAKFFEALILSIFLTSDSGVCQEKYQKLEIARQKSKKLKSNF
jgi:hypothetical protein